MNNSTNGFTLPRFFSTVKNNFDKLLGVNLIMAVGYFPIIFLFLSLFARDEMIIMGSDLFQNLGGIISAESPSPMLMALYALEGLPAVSYTGSTLSYIFLALSALLILTFGVVNAGTAFVLRKIATGESVSVIKDFISAVKSNFKQAFIIGAADAIVIFVLAFNLYVTVSQGNYLVSIIFWGNMLLCLFYFFFRCYLYLQIVTIDLTVKQILKNAFFMTMLGLKGNLVALVGNLACVFVLMLLILNFGSVMIPIAAVVVITFLLAFMAYIKVFSVYGKIKELLIDPFNQADN